MPRQRTPDINVALEQLEDQTLNTQLSRSENYLDTINALKNGSTIDVNLLNRILTVCLIDINPDAKHSVEALNTILTITTKTTLENGMLHQIDLVPSAVAMVNLMHNMKPPSDLKLLKKLILEALISYPNETLIDVVSNHSMKILNMLSVHLNHGTETIILLCKFLHKVISIMPQDKKSLFLKKGLDNWFGFVIPKLMHYSFIGGDIYTALLELTELLSDELADINFFNNQKWQNEVFVNICNSQKFPATLKSLLESRTNTTWHRIWMVLVKLLKNKITLTYNEIGSPINSLLPIVEMSFKMDNESRCKAFKCWDALADNFSMETNEGLIKKRLKLLMIPLRSNNAKFPDTAIAKFNTWWHLIIKFQNKTGDFVENVVIPFLHFCFGKHSVSDPIVIPGFLSDSIKTESVQHFLEIIGHRNCSRCSTVSRIEKSFLTTSVIVDYWNDWMYSLKQALILGMQAEQIQQMKCLWKTIMRNIADLPTNDVRNNLIKELLNMMLQLFEGSGNNLIYLDVTYDALILPLFDEEIISNMFTENEREAFLNNIVKVVVEEYLKCLTLSMNENETGSRLKSFFSNVVLVNLTYIKYTRLGELFLDLPVTDLNVMMWNSLMESLIEKPNVTVDDKFLITVLKWPIKNIEFLETIQIKGDLWYSIYNAKYSILRDTNLHREIVAMMMESNCNSSTAQFMLYVLVALMKHFKFDDNQFNYGPETKLLLMLLTMMNNNYKKVEKIYPPIVKVVKEILQNASCPTDEIAKDSLSAAALVLKFTNERINEDDDQVCYNATQASLIKKLLHSVNDFVCHEFNPELIIHLSDLLIVYCVTFIKMKPLLKSLVISTMKDYLQSATNITEHISNRIMYVLQKFKENISPVSKASKVKVVQHSTKETGNSERPCMKTKENKKSPTIVQTNVEDGEEYVTVNSNWKFDPRKLTDAQKEKFKQKKDDIPALYQDLSQSQDDFRLRSWRPNSDDAPSTSNSTSNNVGASEALEKLRTTHVLSNIIENMLSKNTLTVTIESKDNYLKNKNKSQLTPRATERKRRMTIKDRVCKNLKVLVESIDPKNINGEHNKTSRDVTTPLSKEKHDIQGIHSAPPKISVERPARVKRLPKKFDNLELLTLKRRKQCLNDSQTDNVDSSSVTKDSTTHSDNNSLDVQNCKENLVVKENIVFQETSIIDCNVCPVNNDITTNVSKSTEDVPAEKEIDDTITKLPEIDKEQNNCLEKNEDVTAEVIDENVSTVKDVGKNNFVSTTPTTDTVEKNDKNSDKKSTIIKTNKKSRIEKELAINMVQGHPFLQSDSNSQLDKRITRKCKTELNSSGTRKKTMNEKLDQSKSDKRSQDAEKEAKEATQKSCDANLVVVESQDKHCFFSQDPGCSEDIIESSQDSTLTTISVKSNTGISKRKCVVQLSNCLNNDKKKNSLTDTQNILDDDDCTNTSMKLNNTDAGDDISLPQNKTVEQEYIEIDLTEDMDTEPINEKDLLNSNDVIIIEDKEEKPNMVNIDDSNLKITDKQYKPDADSEQIVDSQDTAHADTETFDSGLINCIELTQENTANSNTQSNQNTNCSTAMQIDVAIERSPFDDEEERKKDFLNNTLQISPIKTLSPIRDKHSPSPETSSDYVVITLSSPVQFNGEPFNKSDSPEVFTSEKVPHNEREGTPPREDIPIVNNNSPSSSLSLKKNRPQVRSGGRGAQMLGLCIPNGLQTLNQSDKTIESEDTKKAAKRNLKTLYTSVSDSEDVEDSEQFLKLKRSLPNYDSSPVGPILKRKLADIADDAIPSPANKRKRVSFHDPPVSTTVAVQKYIEPNGVRSPQSSLLKRQERSQRPSGVLNSPRRLDIDFKTDHSRTAAETTTELETTVDSEMNSLDQTPAVEVVMTSELNNKDPICPELVDCADPIGNIAVELSSTIMKESFVKAIEGKISTIGDLAKLTELEVNRLCIKAPKIKVAKKALTDYACKITNSSKQKEVTQIKACPIIVINKAVDIEVQAKVPVIDAHIQTEVDTSAKTCQTDIKQVNNSMVQTDQSSYMTTDEIIKTHLVEMPDYVDRLAVNLQDSFKQRIAASLPLENLLDAVFKKSAIDGPRKLLDMIFEQGGPSQEIPYVRDYLSRKYNSNDIIYLCSELLQKIHVKTP